MVDVRFYTDPAELLHRAGPVLAADPVVSTVVVSVTSRLADEDGQGVPVDPKVPRWWALLTGDDGEVVGIAMRTAPEPPHAMYLLPMPEHAADSLAWALHERGERIVSANGALPATRRFLEEMARLTGGQVETAQHTRLFELGELVPARPVPGRLRRATLDEANLVLEWFVAFMADADEQAGRVRGASHPAEVPDRDGIARRIAGGRTWLWEDEGGTPVHLTGANAPGFGVCRLGPVYTPPAERGRGWANAAVAEVSRLVLEEGNRACLFTDQANPTSNGIYQALGYRPVVDMANLVIVDAG